MRDATWFDSQEEVGKKGVWVTAIAYAENGNASWHQDANVKSIVVDVPSAQVEA